MKTKTIVVNGIIAALYIAITGIIQPIAFSNVQFRIPEIFNHLVVFNKKYFFGVVIGVFFGNLFFSNLLPYDLFFGVGHSIITLGLTIFVVRFIKNVWVKMAVNTLFFTFTMFIIAYELNLAMGFPFWETWMLAAIGEFVVMAVGMPIIYSINKQVKLDEKI
ncbi:QueT transporter family protein [Bacillus kwashiorkori]|uniref:QueT transporter family protein n=1 Tax=Bacillus kwashiorkori TaxID=1522318 RepID=UPI00078210F8|nr:QueT transporter family protein [Bacillus kwashiorkori]